MLEISSTDAPTSASTVSSSSEPSPIFLNPALIGSLNQLAPLVLICVIVWLGIKLMEQFNRFVELVKKK